MRNDPQPLDGGVRLLLALCPALGASDTVANALGLGAAAVIAAALSSMLIAAVDRWLRSEIRMAAIVLILVGVASALDMTMDAWLHDLRSSIGIFLPLLAMNAVFVLDAAAHERTVGQATVAGLRTGGSVAAVLLALGLARELVGRGSLLHDAGRMFGAWAAGLDAAIFSVDMGFLLAILPPGAFISLGLLLAARNWLTHRRARISSTPPHHA
jgi:Na+-translocating ferredoxin:NAD+ oxidoreductase subunit E